MRILCIMPCFVPEADSEAFCSAKIALELLKSKVELTVISLHKPELKTFDDSKFWKELEEKTIRISSDTGNGIHTSILSGIKFHSLTYTRWLKVVLERAIELHGRHRFDLIYSRSLPMIGHVAGYWVSQKLNRPWIANINDPWDWHLFPIKTSVKMPLPEKLVSDYWFKKTLLSANLITYPNERLRDYHIKLSGIDHAAEVIPHIGYCMDCDGNSNHFRITHAGKLGSNESMGRSTIGLLKGFKSMLSEIELSKNNIKLVLVGQRDSATESKIRELNIDDSSIEITGQVNYQESLRYISKASVCILIEGNYSEGIFLPSKFVDYLAAKKPILALSPKTGTIADFGDSNQIIRIDNEDSDSIKAALCNFYDRFNNGSISLFSNDLSEKFGADSVINKFLKLANEIVSNV